MPARGGADALISAVMAGRSISLAGSGARSPRPSTPPGDSAIASCHEGGSSYVKEDQEPKAEGPDDLASQPLWPGDVGCGPLHVKGRSRSSPAHFGGSEPPSAMDGTIQNSFSGADCWDALAAHGPEEESEKQRHSPDTSHSR